MAEILWSLKHSWRFVDMEALAWIFHKQECWTFWSKSCPWASVLKGFFAQSSPCRGIVTNRQEGWLPQPNAPRPHRGVSTAHISPLLRTSKRRVLGSVGPQTASRGRGRMAHQDVCTRGTGVVSRAVTRWKSALTGQALGRGRRIRSLYCLIWAPLCRGCASPSRGGPGPARWAARSAYARQDGGQRPHRPGGDASCWPSRSLRTCGRCGEHLARLC